MRYLFLAKYVPSVRSLGGDTREKLREVLNIENRGAAATNRRRDHTHTARARGSTAVHGFHARPQQMPSLPKRTSAAGEENPPPTHRRRVMETNGNKPAAGSKVRSLGFYAESLKTEHFCCSRFSLGTHEEVNGLRY